MTRREIIAVHGAFTKTIFYIVNHKRCDHNFNNSKYGVKGRRGGRSKILFSLAIC